EQSQVPCGGAERADALGDHDLPPNIGKQQAVKPLAGAHVVETEADLGQERDRGEPDPVLADGLEALGRHAREQPRGFPPPPRPPPPGAGPPRQATTPAAVSEKPAIAGPSPASRPCSHRRMKS